MFKEFCNDCLKPLEDMPLIHIPETTIRTADRKIGKAGNLHFCDQKCLNSWMTKSINKPNIIVPGGNARQN